MRWQNFNKKGIALPINCAKHLKSLLGPDSPKIVFHLAGSTGNLNEYRRIYDAASNAAFHFDFIGSLSQAELATVYRSCQIFVLPSFYEGLPLSPVEAMACGCRAVITDVPGVRNWLNENAPQARISYVPLPEMRNVDEPLPQALPFFELSLAEAIKSAIDILPTETDLSRITWSGLAARIFN